MEPVVQVTNYSVLTHRHEDQDLQQEISINKRWIYRRSRGFDHYCWFIKTPNIQQKRVDFGWNTCPVIIGIDWARGVE